MSPRPPPKISLRHEWTKELCSKVDRQPRRGSCSTNQVFSNQPNQLQIHIVIDQGDLMTSKMKEKRPVLKRSMLILLTKNSVLQIEQGDLLKQRKFKHVHLKTARVSMLSRFMIEQGDLLLTQLQYKTTLKYIMKLTRSTLMKKYFVKEWRNPLLFTTKIMNR